MEPRSDHLNPLKFFGIVSDFLRDPRKKTFEEFHLKFQNREMWGNGYRHEKIPEFLWTFFLSSIFGRWRLLTCSVSTLKNFKWWNAQFYFAFCSFMFFFFGKRITKIFVRLPIVVAPSSLTLQFILWFMIWSSSAHTPTTMICGRDDFFFSTRRMLWYFFLCGGFTWTHLEGFLM